MPPGTGMSRTSWGAGGCRAGCRTRSRSAHQWQQVGAARGSQRPVSRWCGPLRTPCCCYALTMPSFRREPGAPPLILAKASGDLTGQVVILADILIPSVVISLRPPSRRAEGSTSDARQPGPKHAARPPRRWSSSRSSPGRCSSPRPTRRWRRVSRPSRPPAAFASSRSPRVAPCSFTRPGAGQHRVGWRRNVRARRRQAPRRT